MKTVPRGQIFFKLARSLLCLTVLAFVSGCMDDPYAKLCTVEQPKTNDLVGRYALTEQTITSGGASAMQGRPCELNLRADGTFTASNLPPYVFRGPPINSLKSLVSGAGTWRLGTVGSIDDGSGKMKPHWGIQLDSAAPKFQAPGLTSNSPPYGLIFSIGDPDNMTVMFFERAK